MPCCRVKEHINQMESPVQPSLVRSLGDQELVSEQNRPHSQNNFMKKLFIIISIIIVVLAAFTYFAVYLPGKSLIASVRQLQATGMQVSTYLKAQDLPGAQQQLVKVGTDLQTVETNMNKFSWAKALPVANNYYADGKHGINAAKEILAAGNVTIDAIAPYADVLGFKGLATTGDGAKTAQDRINFIVNTLDKIKPQLTSIGSHLDVARKEMDQIDPKRYPEKYKDQPVRSQLTQAISLLDQASSVVTDAKPFLESLPYMLGVSSPRKYLVIFQNDAELRPTGGFMTAYAVLSVDKGKISIVQSDDIYALDAKFTKKIAAPDPIKKYLPNVPYWYLRDQNLSPDFKASMDTFFPNYQLTGSPNVDGIIAMDTQVLVDLLKVTGPIGVSGFGTYSAANDPRCNCPQVFYELENFADVEGPVIWDTVSGQIIVKPQNYGTRKSFIGPMMYSILTNVMAQPKSRMGTLFTTMMDLINQKHVQLYFTDSATQKSVETFNLAGRVVSTDNDYLMVVDTNFAGAKTNAWVSYSAVQKIDVSGDGSVTKTLTLTYKNPQQYFQDARTKLKLNGVFRDWLRVYVPKGSKLVEAKGFELGQTTSEDLGKTVFEGFFTLTPLNVKTISLKYTIPMKMSSPYQLLLQKQAGAKDFSYQTSINGKSQPEIILNGDKQLHFTY